MKKYKLAAVVVLSIAPLYSNPIIAVSSNEVGADHFTLTWYDITSHDFHVQWGTNEITGASLAIVVIGEGNSISTGDHRDTGSADFRRTGASNYAVQVGFDEAGAHGSFHIEWWQTDDFDEKIPGTTGTWDPDNRQRDIVLPEPGALLSLPCALAVLAFISGSARRRTASAHEGSGAPFGSCSTY
jgi:hypothetical protein